jgi:hypothetical protein
MWSYLGSSVFALANPWGPNSTQNGQPAGMVFLTMNQMIADGFNGWAEVNFSCYLSAVQRAEMSMVAAANIASPLPTISVTTTIGVHTIAAASAHEHVFIGSASSFTIPAEKIALSGSGTYRELRERSANRSLAVGVDSFWREFASDFQLPE